VTGVSERERVAHVVRRLSMGVHPDLVDGAADADAAVSALLDLSSPGPEPYRLPLPSDDDQARRVDRIRAPIAWWLRSMATTRRPLEERLIWFWTDHFATSIRKVRSADLLWRQHLTIRAGATGSFADLLHAMGRDGAMLVYLDGVQNSARQRNENYGREVMELHTLGRGSYTQDDVVAMSRAASGWSVDVPFRPRLHRLGREPFTGFFVPARHDAGDKTLLGTTGRFDLDGALDVLLDHPATARHVAAELHRQLVGLEPDDDEVDRLAAAFRRDYAVTALVEAIVGGPAFTADAAVRARVRTPLEKLVGLVQAVGSPAATDAGRRSGAVGAALAALDYVPFLPPNPAGYPSGAALLGPHQLVHTFDLMAAVDRRRLPDLEPQDLLARFGLHDVSEPTRRVLGAEPDPALRTALVLTSPEYART